MPNWAGPAATADSRRTAARVTRGVISLSSSSHFPAMLYSNTRKPVALPPGRARLSTKPAPTGSATAVNTIGMVRVDCSNGARVGLLLARITSGASATNSVVCWRILAASARGPADIELYVAADAPASFLQSLPKCPYAGLKLSIIHSGGQEHADASHALG